VLALQMGETTAESTDTFIRMSENSTGANTGTLVSRIRGSDGTIVFSFTGQHFIVYKMSDGYDGSDGYDMLSEIQPGMIVESTGVPWVSARTDLAIPVSTIAATSKSKKVFGVMDSTWQDDYDIKYWHHCEFTLNTQSIPVEPPDPNDPCTYDFYSPYFKSRTNSIGEGQIWVTEHDGYIQNGDYITSSVVPGYGSLQDDDLMHNYTVAKCTQDIDWSSITDTIEHESVSYKRALVSCTYHCG